MSEKNTKRANMVSQNCVENDVSRFELDLSAIISVRIYTNNEEGYTLELYFSLLDDMDNMLINFNSREKALELYNYFLENAKNLVEHESEYLV